MLPYISSTSKTELDNLIRKRVETIDNLSSFMVVNAIGGGSSVYNS